MPELQFKGTEFVYNHYLTVPFRPLEIHADKGIGAPARRAIDDGPYAVPRPLRL